MAPQALDNVISHWSTLLEGFQTSPLGFYQAIEGAAERRAIPNTTRSRVEHQEGGVGSAKREYLRVSRETLLFDICGSPFGTGFFVSWWLVDEVPRLNAFLKVGAVIGLLVILELLTATIGLVVGTLVFIGLLFAGLAAANGAARSGDFDDRIIWAVPLVGSLYTWLFKPGTYYRIDSTEMFQKAVHSAVLEVIDSMTAEQGIRALSEPERRPVMREFYERKS